MTMLKSTKTKTTAVALIALTKKTTMTTTMMMMPKTPVQDVAREQRSSYSVAPTEARLSSR
jgi:hypothetical protein